MTMVFVDNYDKGCDCESCTNGDTLLMRKLCQAIDEFYRPGGGAKIEGEYDMAQLLRTMSRQIGLFLNQAPDEEAKRNALAMVMVELCGASGVHVKIGGPLFEDGEHESPAKPTLQ
jgi:hypothetical protein